MSSSTNQTAQPPADEMYRKLAESLPVGVILADPKGINIWANEEAARMTGYSVEELLAGVWMVHPEDTEALPLLNRALSDGTPGTNYETRLIRKDGSVFWVSISWRLVTNEHGDTTGMCTVLLDISERKSAEEELRRAGKRFRQLSEKASDILWEMGEDGRFTYISEAVRHLGFEPEEWIGHCLVEFLPPGEQAIFAERLNNPARKPGPARYEVRLLKKNGSDAWMEVVSDVVLHDGKALGYHGVARDITLRKRAEDALKQSEQKYKSIVENSNDLILLTTPHGRITYASPASVEVCGYSPDELVAGKRWRVHPEDHDRVSTIFGLAGQGASASHIEYRIETKSGEKRWVSHYWSPIMDGDRVQLIVSVMRDITELVRSQEALRQSEQKYKRIVENSADLILLTTSDGSITYASPACRDICGYAPEELVAGSRWGVHRDDRDKVLAALVQAGVGGSGSNLEYRITTKSRETRWVSHSWSAVTDRGQVQLVVSVIRDITEKIRSEEALRESEQKYKSIVENSSDLILLTTPDGKIVYASPASPDINGYEPEELVAGNLWVVHPDDTERMRAAFLRSRQGESASGVLYRLVTKSGETRWVSHSWSPIMDGDQVRLVVSVIRDVTDRIRSQEALRESEERYKSIVENSTDLIMLCRPDGIWTYASPACKGIFGYEPAEVVGTVPALSLPEDDAWLKPIFRRAMNGERGSNLQYRVVTKTGEIRWVSHAWSPIFIGDRLHAVLSVIRDVTEAKQSEEALREAHSELEHAYRLQQEFVNNVTHEVRTPLTAVKGYAEMLLEGMAGPVSEEQSALLGKVLTSSQHLLDVVNGVLEIARLKSGRIALNARFCDPRKVVDKAVSATLPQAQQKGLTINIQSDPDGCPALYDEEKLVIITTNLLTNAIKFTEAGSIDVIITCRTHGAEIIVTDTGMGISSSDLPSIFDEFSQLDYPRKHKPSGFGIGLAIVATMVETMGASLTVSSRKGLGTAFTLCVPGLEA